MAEEGRLTERFGLERAARERRKAFLRLSQEDEALLRSLRAPLAARSAEFIERFYEHLLRFDETRGLLMAEPGRLERLKEIQRRYFLRLLEGDYEEAYFEERLRVGIAHQRTGLDPRWYLGAYSLYLQLNFPIVLDLCGGDRARAAAALGALVKIVFLDLGLAIDTYIGASTSALEESRSYLERVLNSISDGLVVLTPTGQIREVNPAFEALTGYSREELLGLPPSVLTRDSDDAQMKARMTQAAREGSIHYERTIYGKSGEAVAVSVSGASILDRRGNLLGFVTVVRDMRERNRLLEQLEESRSFLERVLSSISDAILVIDPEGRIRDANPMLLKMTGYAREELVGKLVTAVWRDETEPQARERLRFTAEHGRYYDDRRLHAKEGPALPVAFSGAPIFGRHGELLGFVGVARDMTERNRLLGELEQAKATLELRVEERTRELRRAQAQLFQSEKLSAIGQLAAGIAHEIGTPLNVISGRAEYLLSELGDDPRAQNLQVIIGQIERISGLIEQLLDFARDRGDEMGPVRIRRAADAILPLLDSRLRKQGIVLEVDVDGLPDIYGNVNRLQQVFLNLVMNASDAIREVRPKGPGRIAIGGEVDGGDVVLRVSDDGAGIAPENLPRIFDPFFTTKPVGHGTGLGLSVTYGVIREMGGSIRAESTLGHGTTFHMRFRRVGPVRSAASRS
jgi:PAS domain S-box-containing protein